MSRLSFPARAALRSPFAQQLVLRPSFRHNVVRCALNIRSKSTSTPVVREQEWTLSEGANKDVVAKQRAEKTVTTEPAELVGRQRTNTAITAEPAEVVYNPQANTTVGADPTGVPVGPIKQSAISRSSQKPWSAEEIQTLQDHIATSRASGSKVDDIPKPNLNDIPNPNLNDVPKPKLNDIPKPSLPEKRPADIIAQHRTDSAPPAATTISADTRSAWTRLKNLFLGTSIILGLTFSYLYISDTRAGVHRWVVIPSIRYFFRDAEDAHEFGNNILKALYTFGLNPRERGNADSTGDLRVEVFGQTLDNPIGISAGLDKHGEIPNPLFDLGPALVEIGGTTPHPQEGNPKPRVFRIPSQNAIINRYGLNSHGADHVAMQLRQRLREWAHRMGYGSGADVERMILDGEAGVPAGSLRPGKLLAVQVAKNKSTPDSDIDAVRADYVYCVERLARYADVIVVNVSSPNTPGLRDLQKSEPLQHILRGVVSAARAVDRKVKPAVMVKVSPDEDSADEVRGICDAVYAADVDGIIVGNTTKKRPNPLPAGYTLPDAEAQTLLEMGGYSGPQMFDRTLALVKQYRKGLDQQGPVGGGKAIFATGGITNGEQALKVLNAGASVAMVYTALVYGGVGTITRIKDEMRQQMRGSRAIGDVEVV